MKSFGKVGLLAVILTASVGSAIGAEVLVTAGGAEKSGSSRVALDIVTEGNVSGFNFFVRTGELKGAINVSNCVADLPKGFSGSCQAAKDGVYVFAMADLKTVLPAGVTAVGSITLPGGLAKAQRSISIEQLEFADVDGKSVAVTAQIAQ